MLGGWMRIQGDTGDVVISRWVVEDMASLGDVAISRWVVADMVSSVARCGQARVQSHGCS